MQRLMPWQTACLVCLLSVSPQRSEERVRGGPMAPARAIAQVAQAFHPHRGAWSGTNAARTYAAMIDGDGVRLGAYGWPDRAPVRFLSSSIERQGAPAAARQAPYQAADGSVEIVHGEGVERLRNTADGLEQTWSFAQAPRGRGDLKVTVPVKARYEGETAAGLHFADRRTGAKVRYGRATWVGADGARTPVETTFGEGAITLRVPERLLETSRYPAVLDPILSPEVAFDAPFPGVEKGAQTAPAVAFDGEGFLVVWQEACPHDVEDTHILGARLDATGALLDPAGIVISDGYGAQQLPQVVYDGSAYVVVWQDDRHSSYFGPKVLDLYAARVDTAGVVLDPAGIPVTLLPGDQTHPRIASNGNGSLIVFDADPSGDGSGSNVYGLLMARGTSLPGAPFVISAAAGAQRLPAVASLKGDYLVTWEDARGGAGPTIVGARVSSLGVVQDPLGFAVSGAPADQRRPAVSAGKEGYLVVWEDHAGASVDIRGARVLPTAEVLDPAGMTVRAGAGDQQRPEVTFDGADFLVVWDDDSEGGATQRDIEGSWLSPQGDSVGAPIALSSTGAEEVAAAVASTGQGSSTVAYESRCGPATPGGVRARQVTYKNRGDPCAANAECKSQSCVDGVCCNTACGGGSPSDCLACSKAEGGAVDGTCGPAQVPSCGPPADGGVPVHDGGTSAPDGGTSVHDGGPAGADGGTSAPDGGTPVHDGGTGSRAPRDGGGPQPLVTPPDAGPAPIDEVGSERGEGEQSLGYSGWAVGCASTGSSPGLGLLALLAVLGSRWLSKSARKAGASALAAFLGLAAGGARGQAPSARAAPVLEEAPVISRTQRELPPVPPENAHARLHLLGSLFIESVSKQLGGEVGATVAASPLIDVGAAVVLGKNLGYRGLVEWHPRRSDARSALLPFVEARALVHPVPEGVGLGVGAWGGAALEVGPGRGRAGVLAEAYYGPKGYYPYALFAMFGYEVDLLKPERVLEYRDRLTEVVRERRVPEPVRTTVLKGHLTDLEDAPLEGTVKVTRVDQPAPELLLPAGPAFETPLAPGEYRAEASAPLHLSRGRSFTIGEGDTLVQVFQLRPVPEQPLAQLTPQRIEVSQRIEFEFDKATLLPSAYPILDEVVDILLRKDPTISIRIEGHTCTIGRDDYNLVLSQARARAVLEYLVERGVEARRLTSEGYGPSRPIGDNKTEEGRVRNRRVQFELVEPERPVPSASL